MAHIPVIYDGTLPGADSAVATQLVQADIAQHRQHAIDLYQFLATDDKQLLQLNIDDIPRTCIIGLPNSSKVRLIHCMGIGVSPIGAISEIDSQVLCLTGDGGTDIGAPTPLTFPPTIFNKQEVLAMTQNQFNTAITTQGPTYTWPLLPRIRAHEANTTVTVMQIAPVPSFLVMDGINTDIDAAALIERVLSLDNRDGEMYEHLLSFLLACLTGHNVGDLCPRISQDLLLRPATATARRWAHSKFQRTYPTLMPSTPPAREAAPINADVAAILAHLTAQNHRAPPAEEEKKDNGEDDTRSNMSQLELDTTLQMCGLPVGANPALLPEWFSRCSAKHMTDNFRTTILRKQITNNYRYEDAEVPLTNTILKMAVKRNWMGKEGNIDCPSLVNAGNGLSPFIVVDKTEDEVAEENYDDDAINNASTVTPAELLAQHRQSRATVPETSDKFLLMLKRYANLLYALFGADCPLFRCIVQVITAFKAFSRNARDKMSQITRASILWVILKQSRRFAMGEVDVILEFQGMHEHLAHKMLGFNHAETPSKLLQLEDTPADEKRKISPTPKLNEPPPKRPKLNNPNTWHSKLRAALDPAIKKGRNPGFLQVMKYCDQNLVDIFKMFGKKCAPNCFFGTCSRGNECPRDHSLPSDTEVEKILTITKKFQDEPTGITKG
jgi:hypothetical protein